MLSVAKLTPGQEVYYERSVAAGLDDYYAGKGEAPGVWAGEGAVSLGLDGEVEEGGLGSLVRGRHPKTGAELRAHVKARTITIERIDPESGKRWLTPTIFMVIGSMLNRPLSGRFTTPASSIGAGHAPAGPIR